MSIGAGATLSALVEALRAAVAQRPEHATRGCTALLGQLRWFAGYQVRGPFCTKMYLEVFKWVAQTAGGRHGAFASRCYLNAGQYVPDSGSMKGMLYMSVRTEAPSRLQRTLTYRT